MKTTFYQIPIGATFEFRGRQYEKRALSMARDEERIGAVFQDSAEIFWHCEPGAQPGAPRPAEPHWTERMWPAPGEREAIAKMELDGTITE